MTDTERSKVRAMRFVMALLLFQLLFAWFVAREGEVILLLSAVVVVFAPWVSQRDRVANFLRRFGETVPNDIGPIVSVFTGMLGALAVIFGIEMTLVASAGGLLATAVMLMFYEFERRNPPKPRKGHGNGVG